MAHRVLGSGRVAEFAGGMCAILDAHGRSVLSWWPPRVIENPRLIGTQAGYSPSAEGGAPAWIDVCVNYKRDEAARAIADGVAELLGGTVQTRDAWARWNAASVDTVVELAQAFAAISWPVPEEDIPAIISKLGWEELYEGIRTYRTGLGITLDTASCSKAGGELSSVRVNLVDREEEESEDRWEFVMQASGEYVVALKRLFGESRIAPYSRDHAVSYWDLPSGARLSLHRSMGMVILHLDSPLLAEAKRNLGRRP